MAADKTRAPSHYEPRMQQDAAINNYCNRFIITVYFTASLFMATSAANPAWNPFDLK